VASLELVGVVKRFGATTVIQGVDLRVEDGEFVVFVGPSGCGKSTLLRMISGLEAVTEGELRIDGRRVNDVSAAERGLAMVFQSYALYPHMTVYQNMAFGLENIRTPRSKIETKVRAAAALLHLDALLDRRPTQLSGGQRQRVAIGRAIVREPTVFLFDEPLSNLDAELRVEMRTEITGLHKRLKTTMIYVTHDQVEAMTMADRIVVMHDGRIEQIGTPLELYDRPGNLFVAQFIGSPAMNVVNGTVRRADGRAYVEVAGGVRWPLYGTVGAEGQAVTFGVRPEHLTISAASETTVPAEIIVVEPTGAETELLIQAGNEQVILRRHGRPAVNPEDKIALGVDPAHVHLFDQATGVRLS
jgi:multiple sugar transport system ATP-binding protein